MAQLADRITKISEELLDVSTKIKAVDRRLDTLALHIAPPTKYWTKMGEGFCCQTRSKEGA